MTRSRNEPEWCQALADAGKTHEEIVKYFYRGTDIGWYL